MLRFHSRGLKLVDYIDKLMQKYGCSKRALEHDFTRRNKWIPKILLLDDSKSLVNELMLTLDESRAAAWRVFHDADNDNARVGALRTLNESVFKQLEAMQSMGDVKQVSQKFESVISVNPDEALRKLLRGVFADDPVILEELFKQLKT